MPTINAETEWYDQLFKQKFMRVAEDPDSMHLHLDAPYARAIESLTNGQRRWVRDKQALGFTPVLNNRAFVESRDQAKAIVDKMLG